MKKTIRWGILGLGKIAHSFTKDLLLVEGAVLAAVASRSAEKARSFSKEYGAPLAFGSYEELFASDAVDVIYVATPHTSHAELSIRAMENGKHVLCEKPLGVNRAEVERMAECARKNRVFLMEALWSRFNPSIIAVKKLVDSGRIGEARYLHATFGFYALDRDPAGRLLNPILAGGSILDIGIYPVFLAYLMFGYPKSIQSRAIVLDSGVEVQTAMMLEYPCAQALIYSGLSSKTGMKAEIAGTAGNIYLHSRWHEAQGYSVEADGNHQDYSLPTLGKGYSHEIEEVNNCLLQNKTNSDMWSLENSLDLISILDTVRKQNGIVFPFEP